jgi:hypothetical protein
MLRVTRFNKNKSATWADESISNMVSHRIKQSGQHGTPGRARRSEPTEDAMILVASCQRAFIFACRVLLAPGFWLTTETAAKTSFGGFVLMHKNMSRILQTIAGAAMGTALMAVAQTAAPAPAAPAATAAAAPAAPAASPTWSVGPMDISGFIDGYYSYNLNTPAGQLNDLYNFNDKTAQFSLNAAKLTLNHDADPIGARVDLIFGNTDRLMNGSNGDTKYIEQAYQGQGF